jgi:tricorn protease
MPRRLIILALAALCPAGAEAQTRLLRQPTVSASHVAFAYANNIWIASRDGGEARRLTSFQGVTSDPQFSPDGRWVAFSGQYGGNTDVYVVSAAGGEPKRLTWHPGGDIVQGWTPDGTRIVFASGRTSVPSAVPKFWSVAATGDVETPLPMPRAFQGKYSPDGRRIAYRMASSWDDEWRNYRGGQNRPIWIFDTASHDVTSPPWTDSKDIDPVWIGDVVYFLSDRDWAMNVWSYDTKSKQLAQVTSFADFDVKSLDAGGGVLAFEQGGYVHIFDPSTRQQKRLDITVRGDFPWLMPQWKDVGTRITNVSLSPTGKRALVEARGDIFTLPSDKGDWRNLTRSSGSAERTPAWSSDGRFVSYFSDASGEYKLVIESQDGLTPPREIDLPEPSYYYTPAWSPDNSRILYTDAHLRLWITDVATGKSTKIDTDPFMQPDRSINPVWSPDSRWIAYSKRLPSYYRAIFAYDVQGGRTHQLTDGMSDATWPAWDASGKYLYFAASTDYGLSSGWLDMSSYDRPVTRGVYIAVLQKRDPSPLAPESDEEAEARREGGAPPTGATPDSSRRPAAPAPVPTVTIDLEGLSQRILSLGVAPRDYSQLRAGPAGTVFFVENVPSSGTGGGRAAGSAEGRGVTSLYAQGTSRDAVPPRVTQYTISHDRKKLLWRGGGQQATLAVVNTDGPVPQAIRGA